ncbi:MAG: hypothetical protein OEU32_06195 [Acidimicrobiia bacterium]|nr:hypothetical protein [Acidimicrobiia bacterium]
MSRLENELRDALHAAGANVEPADDLFARVRAGIDADRGRRRFRTRITIAVGALTGAGAALTAVLYRNGETDMDWWIFELITVALLTVLALVLGPFIKRFGRSYAADVFRSNPSTGKSFIVLTDFAYYLIFGAYILFTTTIDRPRDWTETVGAEQVQTSLIRVGGILLIIGVLHGVNLIVLPVIGRLLTLNRRLDQQMRELASRDLSDRDVDQPDDSSP